jgi:hypothetical protein
MHNDRSTTPSADRPSAAARPAVVAPLEPIAVGRKDAARLFGIGVATWDRWEAAGLVGPAAIVRGGRKLYVLAELRAWAAAGMPDRAGWQARQAASRRV